MLILEDLTRFTHGPTLRDKLKVLLLSPGFLAVTIIRIQEFFYSNGLLLIAYFFQRLNLALHGIDVLPGAKISGGLRIEHPTGIVIGAGVVIGSNCTIMQGVTLGVRNVSREKNNDKFPVIGNGVLIGANSSILGGITIGDNVVIGAHSLVLVNCAPGIRLINEIKVVMQIQEEGDRG
jgi:serine O-acetyltransferase